MKKTMQRPINSFDGKSQMQPACQTQVNLPKGNPLRILEPNRKRLTSLKAERVLRVSEENIKNVQIVFILPKVSLNGSESSFIILTQLRGIFYPWRGV
jgi:hypothetical protein